MAENILEIYNLGVKTEVQRKGIGRELLERLINEISIEPLLTIFLEVRSSNAKAIAFYEGFGFKAVSIRKGFYSQPVEDAIVMKFVHGGEKKLD